MKTILSVSTKVVKAGLAAKGVIETALSPVKAVRDFVKKLLIKSIVAIVKKAINLSMRGKLSADSHIVVKQLNALTDANADVTGISKNIQFRLTLDSLVEQEQAVDEYKVLKYINLTKVKNSFGEYKNSLRKDVYDYMSENSFENISSLVNGVNEVLRMPTEMVGCQFVDCKVTVESHDEVKQDFVLLFDVAFCMKASQ